VLLQAAYIVLNPLGLNMNHGVRPQLSCTWGAAGVADCIPSATEAVGQRGLQCSLCCRHILAVVAAAVLAADASLQRGAEHALQWSVWCAGVAAAHDVHNM
jgi:hypothetical protein